MKKIIFLMIFVILLVLPIVSFAGENPESVAVDSTGKYVYVANNGSNNISMYRVGPDGILTDVNAQTASPQPKVAQGGVASVKGTDGRFIAYDNGTVLDTKTGLMWAAWDNGGDIIWQNAKGYCEHYRGGGYTNWRMPTMDELASLSDESKPRVARCGVNYTISVATELIDISCDSPWASENEGSGAAYFGFHSSKRKWGPKSESWGGRALPVRNAR